MLESRINYLERMQFHHTTVSGKMVKYIDHLQKRMKYGAEIIKNDDKATCFYTGLSRYSLFVELFELLKPLIPNKGSVRTNLSLVDEFFGVLVKLRLGVPHLDIAYRLNVTEGAVSKFFHKWLDVMCTELQCLIPWPDDDQLRKNLSQAFRKHYINVA